MSYLNDVLLGIIEGITEFLPISSTGHLLLAEYWLGAKSETYNIAIQAGAILAVTLIYWRRIVQLFFGWNAPENRDYLVKLTIAFLITAILGLVAKKAGFAFDAKRAGFLIQGDDRPGALAEYLKRLADAEINVAGIDGVTAGAGRWGAILWVESADLARAARTLRARRERRQIDGPPER